MKKFTKNQKILFASVLAVFAILIGALIFLLLRGAGRIPSGASGMSGISGSESGSDSGKTSSSQDPSLSDERIAGALESLISTDVPATTLDAEKANFDAIDFTNRLFRPRFDTKVTLYIATLPEKPAALPSGQTASSAPGLTAESVYAKTALIDSTANPVRWFAMVKDASLSAAKYIWQVGEAPFPGKSEEPLSPPALLASGEIDAAADSFSIDFSAITGKKSSDAGSPAVQKTYYVRVLPLDALGHAIGDGGTGSPVLYGKPATTASALLPITLKKFTLLALNDSGKPSFKTEFPDSFAVYAERILDSGKTDLSYYFLPQNAPGKTIAYVIQVSKASFSKTDWDGTAGLVYERRIHAGTAEFDEMSKYNAIRVDFSEFAPPQAKMADGEKISYAVRLVALQQGSRVGTVTATLSQEMRIVYGKPDAINTVFYETKFLKTQLPEIQSWSYTPAQWETGGWKYHYVVTRQPKTSEIFPGFGFGVGSGDELFDLFPVGTKLDFTPHPEDKSWWEEAIDAIGDFFSDIAGFFADIVNWVSETYESLKTNLVSFVAKYMTYLTPSLRGFVEDALRGLVDYGLASIGIPPSLPNFDELSNMGADYLATLALEKAGVPAADYFADGVTDLAGGIKENLTETANSSASPNPFGWDFIRLDPDYLYRPAYLMVEIRNPYDVATPAGYLSGYNEFIIDTSKGPLSGAAQTLYAKFSGNVYYRTFKVVCNQKIPALAPGQTINVPVFLEEFIGESLWTDGPKVSEGDFKNMYYQLGEYDFYFTFSYELPPAYEKAKELKLPTESTIYQYESTGYTIHFKTDPFVAVNGK